MNESMFNLSPKTMQKLKESQMNIWSPAPGPNGEQPPAELPDDRPWKHQQLEEVVVEKVEIGPDQRNDDVTVVRVQFRGVGDVNAKRVHTEWVRLWPPFDDGNFSRNTLENLAKLGQLLDACGFDPTAKETALLPSLREIPEGTKVVGLLEMFCRYNAKKENYFVAQEFVSFHPAA